MGANEKRNHSEVRIRGIAETKRKLSNIAANLGIDWHVFMKGEFAKIINSYPPHLREDPKDF
jgi:hypothetical protein